MSADTLARAGELGREHGERDAETWAALPDLTKLPEPDLSDGPDYCSRTDLVDSVVHGSRLHPDSDEYEAVVEAYESAYRAAVARTADAKCEGKP